MYIRVRKLGEQPGTGDLHLSISKKAKIEELRTMIFNKLGHKIETQRLFYKGKQLVDDHCLMEYGIQLNDVVQLMIKTQIQQEVCKEQTNSNSRTALEEIKAASEYYKIGDLIDMKDVSGAWFEGIIVDIVKNVGADESDLIFKVVRQSETERAPTTLKFDAIRPRSHYIYDMSELTSDMVVLANYNFSTPKSMGYWYDFKVCEIKDNCIRGIILCTAEDAPMEYCYVTFTNEIFRIELPVVVSERIYDEHKLKSLPLRKVPHNCVKCKDVATRKCKECGCQICGGKNNWGEILLCDECDYGFHIGCLDPPLVEVPKDDEWYCPNCKVDKNEIVQAGDKLKFSKKKAKMASSNKDDSTSRDWGRGMACVGRRKECTIVPKNHLGPIPGVESGMCWKFRFQLSERGVHRPIVAGIHGRASDYAYSIVLSGGYEDDVDYGDEFYYTGSGGRDLSGNKRVNTQSCDQMLTNMNKALANSCNAKFNAKDGAEADDWKGGKPVRVVRNYKLQKYSKYAPKEGNRYDGIYKIVKYYPEKGKSGFIVWRYFLRRDDPEPAPWHENGREMDVIYPDDFFENQAREKDKTMPTKTPHKKRGTKRNVLHNSNITDFCFKKIKPEEYKIENGLLKKINNDKVNEKLWEESKQLLKEGKHKFLSKVEELFMCICCLELLYLPITTECKHNICKNCLKRSFSSNTYSCPHCRFFLGEDYKYVINENLSSVLQTLFPGYKDKR